MKRLFTAIVCIVTGVSMFVLFISNYLQADVEHISFAFLLLPLTFTGTGILVAIQPFGDARMYRRKRAEACKITAIAPRSVREVELTPSESVLMNATRYAGRVEKNGFVLLDGETRVSESLLAPLLAAAFAANVRRGAIELRIVEWPNSLGIRGNRLVAFPASAETAWPAWTIEPQLVPVTPAAVSDIVNSWLAHQSESAGKRGLEKAAISLTLRGLARLDFSPRFGRYYRWAIPPSESEIAAATEPCAGTFEAFQEREPEIAAALEQAIDRGIKSRDGVGGSGSEVDPWLDEAASDREPFRDVLDLETSGGVGIGAGVIISLFVWLLLGSFLADLEDSIRTTAWSFAVVALGSMVYLWYWSRRRSELSGTTVARNLIVGIPLGLAAVVLVIHGYEANPILTPPVTAFVVFLTASRVFRKRIKARLGQYVADAGERNSADVAGSVVATTASEMADSPRRDTEPPAPVDEGDDLTIEVVDHYALPKPSLEAAARMAAINQRGLSIRAAYALSALLLATGTVGLAWIAWLLDLETLTEYATSDGQTYAYGPPSVTALGPYFETTASFYVVTLVLFACGKGVEWMFRRGAQISSNVIAPNNAFSIGEVWRSQIRTIRPLFFPLLGGIWFLIDVGALGVFAQVRAPWHFVLFGGSCVLPIAAYLWLRRARAGIERRYPVFPPLRLLALRVFNSTELGTYFALIDRWHWFGTLLTLEGPDTSGEKLRDFARYVTGTIDHGIIRDQNQLSKALDGLNEGRNGQLRFAAESLQFDDASWREALKRILDRSNVVVMDLTGFSPSSGGCIYEITTLIDKTPLSRFVLLVNETTDIEFLKSVIRTAWAARTSESPNASIDSPVLHLFRIGGELQRGPGESQLEWQRRLELRFDRDRLVTMLFDAALAEQPESVRAELSRPEAVPWGTIALPSKLRTFGKWLAVISLTAAVLGSLPALMVERVQTAPTEIPSAP